VFHLFWPLNQYVFVHAGGTGPPMRLTSSGSMGSANSIGSESPFFAEGPRQSSLGTTLAAIELRELALQQHNLRSQQQQQQQHLHEQNMPRGTSMPVLNLEAKSPRAIQCARQVCCGDVDDSFPSSSWTALSNLRLICSATAG